MRLFAAHGFDAVTVEDIAAEVGISARTFFRYFASKDEVVLRYQRRLQARLVAVFETHAAAEPPITALRNAYVATSAVAPEDRAEFVLLGRFLMDSHTLLARSRGEQTARNGEVVALLAEKLGIDPRRDARAETIAAAMSAAASSAFYRWVSTGGHGDPGEGVAAALDLLRQGLAAFDNASTTPARRIPGRSRDPRRVAVE